MACMYDVGHSLLQLQLQLLHCRWRKMTICRQSGEPKRRLFEWPGEVKKKKRSRRTGAVSKDVQQNDDNGAPPPQRVQRRGTIVEASPASPLESKGSWPIY